MWSPRRKIWSPKLKKLQSKTAFVYFKKFVILSLNSSHLRGLPLPGPDFLRMVPIACWMEPVCCMLSLRLKPSILSLSVSPTGRLVKYDIEICRFLCILTATKNLVLARQYFQVHSGGGQRIPTNFLSVIYKSRKWPCMEAKARRGKG